MGKRLDTLLRILYIIPGIIYTYALAILFYLIYIFFVPLDLLAGLIFAADMPGGAWIEGIAQWHLNNTIWLITGRGEWEWLP